MRKVIIILSLWALSLPLCAGPIPATIIVEPNLKFENVYINVDRLYKVVGIEFADSLKLVSFSKIEAIYNLDGKDITQAVLYGKYKPSKVEKKLAKENHFQVYKPVKKHWSIGLKAGGLYSPVVGYYYKGTRSKIGLQGDFMVALNSRLSLLMGGASPQIRFQDDYHTVSSSPVLEVTGQTQKIRSGRFFLGLQYYFESFVRMEPNKTIPYVFSGFGLLWDKIEFKASYRDLDYEKSYFGIAEYNANMAYLFIGAGITFPILSWLGLDLRGDLNWIISRNRIDDNFNWVVPIAEPKRDGSSLSLDLKLSLIYIN
jgi:hypothetical protein